MYHNTGPQIRQRVAELQQHIDNAAILLELVTGADNHIVPTFVADLRSGRLLTIADSRYVLVDPPHKIAPPRLDDMLFELSSPVMCLF